MAPGGFDTARRQRAHGRAVPGLEMSSRSGDRGERDRGQDGAQRRDIRVFVGADGGQTLAAGAMVAFSDDQAHYLRKVMRLVEGSEVKVFDGASGEWWCRVEFTPGKRAVGVVTEQRRAMAVEADVWLLFAPVKGGALETIVQKGTELGASRLVPVITQRTEVRTMKRERLQTIVLEAAEQCERLTCPQLAVPTTLAELCAAWIRDAENAPRTLIFCDESADSRGSLAQTLGGLPSGPAAILIGPEGGFSPEERLVIAALPGALPVSLGPRILRADTAALAALAVFQACAGDWTVKP